MKQLLLFVAVFSIASVYAQPSLILKKQRPPELDVSTYKQIAVGDIVGPVGSKTEQSLDLTDVLTAKLFNANTLEVIDRNALDNLMGTQRTRDLQLIDETTKQLLNKKLQNALLISGRIQSEKLKQNQVSVPQSIIINGCTHTYYWQIKGEVTIQLRILDVKTGRMLYTDAVSKPVNVQSKAECQLTNKFDIDDISRNAIKELSTEISKLVVPYEVSYRLQFSEPGLLKSPFKELEAAVSYLQINNTDAGLAILKDYTENKSVKDKNKDDAWYNYGLGLLYAGKYADSRKAFQMSASLKTKNLSSVAAFIKFMDDEEQVARKLEAQAIARKKLEEMPEEKVVADAPIKPQTKAKPVIAAPVKKKKAS